jgi:hypothetical protein
VTCGDAVHTRWTAGSQPQQPPPQQPPPLVALLAGALPAEALPPPTATGVNTRLVSPCPEGQGAGVGASSSPRRTSNSTSQVRQR